jgi:aromatic ring hydroxylase
VAWLPASVLFCCDHNAVRSPMAEGLMKKLHGQRVYVQSAGVKHDMEVDGFAVAVCAEIGVELEKHKARSFLEMQAWGEPIEAFEKIVALSPASPARGAGVHALVLHRRGILADAGPHGPRRDAGARSWTPTARRATSCWSE